MIYSLHIVAAPYTKQAAQSALLFAKAAIKGGHSIKRVFFSSDGVHCGSSLTTPPQDEIDIPKEWATLANENEIDMVLCVAAALKRGLLDKAEAGRYSKQHHNIDAPYTLSGLGQLIEASVQSDRLITFG